MLKTIDVYYTKAIEHYKDCLQSYPNGWNDKGLGGMALLAKHYYATKQRTELEDTLTTLEPLLVEAKGSEDILRSLPYVRVNPESQLTTKCKHTHRLAIWARETFHYHPVYVSFQLLEKMAHEKGNLEDENKYKEYMEEVDNKLVTYE